MNFEQIAPLLCRLNDAGLPHDAKQQLERALAAFRQQPDALAQAQAALDGGALDAHATWHALAAIEHVAEFRACHSDAADVEALRAWLLRFVDARAPALPAFLATKALLTLAALFKGCWPARLPSLLEDLLARAETPCGLRALAIVAEELTSPRCAALDARRRELRAALAGNAPRVLATLVALLHRPQLPAPTAAAALECARAYAAVAPSELLFGAQPPALLDAAFAHLRSPQPEPRSAAADLLQELLSRPQQQAQQRLSELFEHGLALATALAAAPREQLGLLEDEGFLSRACQLVLSLARALRRVPTWSRAGELLGAVAALAAAQPSVAMQLTCLEGLHAALDDVLARVSDGEEASLHAVVAAGVAQAQERALTLALRATNGPALASLDDASSTDDEDESELGIFVSECLDVAAAAAEILPDETLPRLGQLVVSTVDPLLASNPSEDACADAATMLALAGRLSELVVGDNLSKRADVAQLLFGRTLAAAEWANSVRLCTLGEQSFALAHARLIGSLPAWFRWLDEILRSDVAGGEQIAGDLASRSAAVALSALQSGGVVPQVVALSAAQTFRRLCESVRVRTLSSSPAVSAVLATPPQALLANLELSVQSRLVSGVVALLCLPWARLSLDKQCWDARRTACANFLSEAVTSHLVALAKQRPSPTDRVANEHCEVLCSLASAVVHDFRGEGTSAKKTVWAGLGDTLGAAVELCVCFRAAPSTMLHPLALLDSLIDGFGSHIIGTERCVEAVSALVSLIGAQQQQQQEGPDPLARALSPAGADGSEIAAICRVLDLLRSLAREPRLLEGALWLALGRVFPLLEAGAHPSVLRALVRLVAALASHHWRIVASPQWLPGLVGVLLAALRGTDLNAYRDALEALERNRLLEREPLRSGPHTLQLAHALASSVVAKTHELQRDDSISALHTIASVSWQGFLGSFLPAFAEQLPNLRPEQRQAVLAPFAAGDTDLPTFSACWVAFANDYAHFSKANGCF